MLQPTTDFPAFRFSDTLRRIAAEHGTPTYVYFETIIRERVQQLRAMVAGLPAHLHYAMKANYTPAVLRVLLEEGFGVDAVSPGEMALALRLGWQPENVLFSPNFMSDEEMHEAHECGVLLNIGELSRLERYGQAYPGSRVCVRINPQIGGGHHAHVVTAGETAKFGIPVAEAEDVKAVAARYDLRIVGLHQHIGSGILDTPLLWQAMHVLLEIAPDFTDLEFLNFGGGFGTPYRPDEAPISVEAFQRDVTEPLRAVLADQGRPISVIFEPGRFLVAESGVLLTKVTAIKPTQARTFAGTDSGFNHLVRPTMYGAYHAITNLSHPDGPPHRYDVAGNICESGDLFARDRVLPELREGDLLALRDAGAYGFSMASTYNLRPLPSEVFVHPDGTLTLIRRRKAAGELIDEVLSA